MTTCAAPTAMHDGLNPRLYIHIAPRASMTLCDGCAASAQLTMDWRLDRRSDPQRQDRTRFPGGGSMLRRSPSALPSRRPVAAARLGNTPGYAATD